MLLYGKGFSYLSMRRSIVICPKTNLDHRFCAIIGYETDTSKDLVSHSVLFF